MLRLQKCRTLISLASGSEVALLQDFIIFAEMSSTLVVFLEFDFEMKVSIIFSRVTGLKSNGTGAGAWAVTIWTTAGMIFYVFSCCVLGDIQI